MTQRREQAYRLSPTQEGMLFHFLHGDNTGIDLEQIVCTLREPVDAEALRFAWEEVVRVHPELRTSFRWQDVEQPIQEIDPEVELSFATEDWSGGSVGEKEEQQRLDRFLAEDRERGFDLAAGPLLRLRLFRLDAADFLVRILVTGGAGYVGGFTARYLLEAGQDVVILDNLGTGHREAIPTELLVVGDIGESYDPERIFSEHTFDAVMHFSASAYVGESVRDPRTYYRNNIANTLTLLETMLDHDIRRLVFSSTCAVYAETAEMPLREDALQDPASPYAFSKLAIERMIRDFSRAYGLDHVLLRYFNAAGACADGTHGEDHRPETHLIPLALQTILGRHEKLDVFGSDYPTPDGTCVRDYVHVEDLAQAHELALRVLMEEPRGEVSRIYNIGTGTGHSVMEVLQMAERVTGSPVPHELTDRRPGDTARLVASSEKIQRELGWKPRYENLEPIVTSG